MARLPSVQPANGLTRQAQTAVSPSDIANPYRAMAGELDKLGDSFLQIRHEKAAQEGAASVYRDEAGDLQVTMKSSFSGTGRAYNRAAQQAYTARISGDIRSQGAAIARESGNDAVAFQKAWKSFANGIVKKAPKELQGSLTALTELEGDRFFSGIVENKRKIDLKTFESDMKAEISALDDEMAALARSGGTGTPAYFEKQEQMASLYNELVQNPDFTMGEKEAELSLKRQQSHHTSEAILGSVERALETGGVAEASRLAKSLIEDQKLLLSPAERRQYSGLANQAIRGWQSERKANLAPIKETAKAYSANLKQGIGLNDPEIDTVAQQLAAGGDVSGAMKLLRDRSTARFVSSFENADNAGQVATMEQFMSQGAVDASQILRDFESFSPDTYWDVNADRVGYGSDTITLADGTVRTVKKGDKVSRKDAERDLARRVGDIQRQSAKIVGEDRWNALGENVKAAVTSVIYNYGIGELKNDGDLGRVLGALQDGDARDVALAVESLSHHNGGINAKRRAKEAAIIRGEGDMGIDPAVASQMRTEITSDAKDLWGDIKAGISDGFTPSDDEVDLLSRQLALINDDDFRNEVSEFFQIQSAVEGIETMPPQAAQKIVDTLKQDVSDGSTAVQRELISAIQGSVDATRKAIDTNLLGFGVSKGIVDALPDVMPGSQGDIGKAFQDRERSAIKLSRMYGKPDVSVFQKDELPAIRDFLKSASLDQQVNYLSQMSGSLTNEMYVASVAELAGKDAQEFGVAGMLLDKNPEVAKGILRGKKLMSENPALVPKNNNESLTYQSDILPIKVFAFGAEGARQGMMNAATARYADLSAQAGDQSREFNFDRMERAVAEVTGGLVSFNGSKIIAPEYGMSQSQFDAAIQSLPSSAFEGAIDANGRAITKDHVMRHGRLRSIGDGEYLIESGSGDFSSYAHSRKTGPGGEFGGGAFILRMGVFDGLSS